MPPSLSPVDDLRTMNSYLSGRECSDSGAAPAESSLSHDHRHLNQPHGSCCSEILSHSSGTTSTLFAAAGQFTAPGEIPVKAPLDAGVPTSDRKCGKDAQSPSLGSRQHWDDKQNRRHQQRYPSTRRGDDQSQHIPCESSTFPRSKSENRQGGLCPPHRLKHSDSSGVISSSSPALSSPDIAMTPLSSSNFSGGQIEAVPCDLHAVRSAQAPVVIQHLLLTLLVLTLFVVSKSYYNHVRRKMARCTVFIIGAGPTGLTSALIASQNPQVSRVIVYEELTRSALIQKGHQVEFNRKSRAFLSCLGVDFDGLEGCLAHGIFHTRVGVFLEYLLELLALGPVPVTLMIGSKFNRERVAEIESYPGRKVVIAADGSSGQSARLLGLSDEFVPSPCHAYGAVASMERLDVTSSVPLAERRVHGLVFDLRAYGLDLCDMGATPGFSLKMHGSTRYRHMSIALPSTASQLVKQMRLILDRSLMRNIFTQCFNKCKWSSEAEVTDQWAARHMSFSPRLFDIKLFQRRETIAYFQDWDMFVMVEGEASRCCNFNTGLNVNLALSGLSNLPSVVTMCACALTEFDIFSTMLVKSQHSENISKQFQRTGLKRELFTHCYD